jgi:hypothetical protein
MTTRRRNIRTQTEQELAELEAAELAASTQIQQPGLPATSDATHVETRLAALPAQVTPRPAPREKDEESEDSRAHLVKHRRPRAEEEEEQFERVYKRETYYIDRTYLPRLKKLIKKLGDTKTAVMNEALEDLFTKHGIE